MDEQANNGLGREGFHKSLADREADPCSPGRDRSNGYEAIAAEYARTRTPSIGPNIVREWARTLQPGAAILDIGCGHGVPISETLIGNGFAVHGVDASAAMIARFRERFPGVPAECGAVEDSLYWGRTFDAAIAWGLMFLLTPETQRSVIGKIAGVLKPKGKFLFTSPRESCTWMDAMTGLPSVSLGFEAYEQELAAHGMALVENAKDEGDNYYYFATKL